MVVRWAFASVAGDLRTSNSGMDPSIEFAIISALCSIHLIEVGHRGRLSACSGHGATAQLGGTAALRSGEGRDESRMGEYVRAVGCRVCGYDRILSVPLRLKSISAIMC
jgi:hypothetical protein